VNGAIAKSKQSHADFLSGLKGAQATQASILRRILESNRHCAFGKEHQFADCTDLSSFRQRVPLRTFDDFRSYIDRTVAGEQAVMSSDPVYRYISSSGSTGQAKVIPLTREYFRQAFIPFYTVYLCGAAVRHPSLLANSRLTVNLKWDPLREKAALANGAEHVGLSQINLATEFESTSLLEPGTDAPWSTVPASIPGDLERIYYRLRLAAEHDVRQFVGVNPAILAALPGLLNHFADRLIEELALGTCMGTPHGAPNPELAARLRLARREHTILRLRDLWPHVDSLICWDEAISGFYLPHLAHEFGDHAKVIPAPLAASECPIALHLLDQDVRGVMAYHTVFYEFLDVEKGPSSPPLQLHELRLGGKYGVVATQQSGFYRYVLGDIVEVTGFLDGVPTVAYSARYASSRDIQESELLAFMRELERECGLQIRNFTFEKGATPELRLVLELAGITREPEELTPIAMRAFSQRFHDRSWKLATLQLVPHGTFFQRWKARVELGLRPPQVKDKVLTELERGT
jgi:hypothetical protein